MQVKLSTGKEFTLQPLTLAQVRRMVAATDAGRGMDATVQACADSTSIASDQIEETLSIPEANELFVQVLEVSGLNMGEAKAVASTSMTSTAASSPTVQ